MPAFTRENNRSDGRPPPPLYTPFVYGVPNDLYMGTEIGFGRPHCARFNFTGKLIPMGVFLDQISDIRDGPPSLLLRRQNSLVEKFWKHRLTRCAMSDTQEPWETTAIQNLMRYRPSGTFLHARSSSL